jgi:hypothetical protein
VSRVKAGAEVAKVVLAVVAGVWAYFLFFKQRTIARRIEFDVSCRFLGPQEGAYIAEYTLTFLNKGLVRQVIRNLKFSVHGIKKDTPLECHNTDFLNFPDPINTIKNLLKEIEYMFIEPGINQNFRHIGRVGTEFSFIRVSAEFLYREGLEHTAARVFEVKASEREIK